MPILLGIDVGTSATKVIACDGHGRVLAAASEPHTLHCPRPGWSEQDPEEWWRATAGAVRRVLAAEGVRPDAVAGVGLSGQMHGLVLLAGGSAQRADRPGDVLRPAILWNDQRTAAECEQIEAAAGGKRALVAATGNAALPGFTAPKLLWVRRHEAGVYGRAGLMLLPKDFVRLRLTGRAAIDAGDASGTMLLDAATRAWRPATLAALAIDPAILPPVLESADAAGRVSAWASRETGLPEGVVVAAGSGDNMAGAVGAGIVGEGRLLATLGTSGVVYAHAGTPRPDLPADPAVPAGRTHVFCAGDGDASRRGGYGMTGCTLSAGGALQWARDALWPGASFDELLAQAARVPPGCEGLAFLPYLSGERAPHPDPAARGAWVGLSLRHTRAHLVRAVLEGVTFTMRELLDLFAGLGLRAPAIRLGGGGARSPFWRQMQADVYGAPVTLPNTEEGPALGAAIMGGVAAGVWPSVHAACDELIHDTLTVEPRQSAAYDAPRAAFARLYGDLRDAFARAARP